MPSLSTIKAYTSAGAHDPDGILYNIIKFQLDTFNSEVQNKKNLATKDGDTATLNAFNDEDHLKWLKMGSLAFDSKKFKPSVF